ncbi:MAG: hypothetical protein AMXMBFR13_39230 [Phycisphaerae bacterium]
MSRRVSVPVRFLTAGLLAATALAGCVPPAAVVDDANIGVDPKDFPSLRVGGEPNDTFAEPVDVIFDDQGSARLQGTIASSADVDIYALGPMTAGDRIIIDVGTPSGLDAAVAVFDEAGRLAFENDDRNLDVGLLDPFLNAVIRRDSSVYFLAIAAAPLGEPGRRVGAYEILLQVARGGVPPATAGQLFLLDFDGGTIDIPGDRVYTVGAFNAGDIAREYAGQTSAVRQQVLATVLENYEGLELDVRMVPGDALPPAGTFSRVLFGGRNPSAFGISQSVDPYNADPADGSIVFTDMFTPARFGRVLTPRELGIAIGNVATHEMGHILGLNHVADIFDLMDTTGGPSTLLIDQEFLSSPLDESIFPLGVQDSLLLLLETLGPAR